MSWFDRLRNQSRDDELIATTSTARWLSISPSAPTISSRRE